MKALLLAACLALPSLASAQSPIILPPGEHRLTFDHDGVGVTRWEQQIDEPNTPWFLVDATAVSPGVWRVPFLPMTAGSHDVRMRACYSPTICSAASLPLNVTFIVVTEPKNLRIEPMAQENE